MKLLNTLLKIIFSVYTTVMKNLGDTMHPTRNVEFFFAIARSARFCAPVLASSKVFFSCY